jgi:hypothetical protein
MSKVLKYTIFIIWLPFSIPLIALGIFFRLSLSSIVFGYKSCDLFLNSIYTKR